MKASVVFSRAGTDSFDDFKQKFEGQWIEEFRPKAIKFLTEILNIRLQRAVKNLTDDDIRTMWDELKACAALEQHSSPFVDDIGDRFEYELPMRDIYLSLFDIADHFTDERGLCYDFLAILFELEDGKKILVTWPGSREKFTDDDTIECL